MRPGKTILEQFYTQPSVMFKCLTEMVEYYSEDVDIIVDASCGDNTFLKICKAIYPKADTFAFDIQSSSGVQKDFRQITAADLKFKAGGLLGFNPPFGKNGKLAKEYLDHMIQVQSPSVILIILPQSLELTFIAGYTLEFVRPLASYSFFRLYDEKPFNTDASCFLFVRR